MMDIAEALTVPAPPRRLGCASFARGADPAMLV
jgi:hypothetical protein